MVEYFRLAYANLQEFWSLFLPPLSLLALMRLSAAPPASFTIAPQLWARIVYDFILAFHLRTINRGHLLGAFTSLYLAWVASYLRSAGNSSSASSRVIAETESAFQLEKPYLLARWRWPDRFDPIVLLQALSSPRRHTNRKESIMGQQIEFALRQSLHRMVLMLVSFLPGVLAFLLALVFFTLLGTAVCSLLFCAAYLPRCILTSAFPLAAAAQCHANISPTGRFRTRPHCSSARAIFWVCEFVGIALGLSVPSTPPMRTTTFQPSFSPTSRTSPAPFCFSLRRVTLLARFLSRSVLISAVNAQLQYTRASLGLRRQMAGCWCLPQPWPSTIFRLAASSSNLPSVFSSEGLSLRSRWLSA